MRPSPVEIARRWQTLILCALVTLLAAAPLLRAGPGPPPPAPWRCPDPVLALGAVRRPALVCMSRIDDELPHLEPACRAEAPPPRPPAELAAGPGLPCLVVDGERGAPCRWRWVRDPGLAALLVGRPVRPGDLSAAALEALPRLGPTLAGRTRAWLDARPDGEPAEWRDLAAVRGIGPVTVQRLVEATRPLATGPPRRRAAAAPP